nr:MAG TPA: Myofilin [Caudoviricetes sp.]
MNREMCLDEAKKCVCTDRNQQYGEPEQNFAVIAQLWQTYLRAATGADDIEIFPSDVAMMMVLFKAGRRATAVTEKADTYVDIAGYAACGCELGTEKTKNEDSKER